MGWMVAAMAAVIVIWIASSGRRLGRFYAREHFVEVTTGLRRIRDEMDVELRGTGSPADLRSTPPPVLRTKEGLNIAWTARKTDRGFEHHVSQSSREVAWAANGTLLAFVLDRLGIPWEDVDVFQSQAGVIHADVTLTSRAHESLMGRTIEDPPAEEFKAHFAGLMDSLRRRGPPRRASVPAATPEKVESGSGRVVGDTGLEPVTMRFVIAQGTEITDAAPSWGDQFPALGLGLLVLRRPRVAVPPSPQEDGRGESGGAQGPRQPVLEDHCRDHFAVRVAGGPVHRVQAEAVSTIQENSKAIGSFRSAMERPMAVTQDLSQVLVAARAEIQARR